MNAWKLVGLVLLIWHTTVLTIAPALAQTSSPEAGQAIYERACVGCHGPDGRGGRMGRMLAVAPRNLADHAYMQTRSTEQLFAVIKHGSAAQGLSEAMPGFGNQLTDAQIRDTVAYVKTLSKVASSTAGTVPPSLPPAHPERGVRAPPSPGVNKTGLAFAMLAGVTAIYASCVFLWRHTRPQHRSAAVQAAPSRVPASVPLPSPHANFCSNCGRKLQQAYHFCPGCGRPLQGH